MRYFIKLAYNGASFHGWQRQPNASSVQETVEDALSTIFRVTTPIVGAGRTDTGVNARVMYAHFDSEASDDVISNLPKALNSLLPRDVVVDKIIPVHDSAHARFDATERSYRYFVSHQKNAFAYPFCWFSPSELDYEAMNEAASLLLNTSDFTSFAKLHSDAKTNICDVRKALWMPVQAMDNCNKFMMFEITADRFLRNMVRAVVGTLVDVGRHKLTVRNFTEIISSRNRCAAGTSMPPQALFLWDVTYPYIS